jgi:hypothetical protein
MYYPINYIQIGQQHVEEQQKHITKSPEVTGRCEKFVGMPGENFYEQDTGYN